MCIIHCSAIYIVGNVNNRGDLNIKTCNAPRLPIQLQPSRTNISQELKKHSADGSVQSACLKELLDRLATSDRNW
jgi:hypothetical protein